MGDIEEECNTGLSLGLGIGCYTSRHERRQDNKPMMCLDLSFTLCTKQEAPKVDRKADNAGLKKMEEDVEEVECTDNNKFSYEEINNLRTNNGGRKKLRLTKEQSTLLEDSFKLHTTLNPVQKQSLAQQLKLKPRQVEVWFQNRRARTKLKQTETNCEFLKKCCERLSEENQRLKRELQELQNLRAGAPSRPPLCIQMPKTAAKLPFCGPCEKPVASNEGIRSASSAAFEVVLRNHKL